MNSTTSTPEPWRARPRRFRSLALTVGLTGVALLAVVSSCSSTTPNRDPVGEPFPEVEGESLEGEAHTLPLSEPSVFLVGYDQDAQFDADRWLIGLLQETPPVRIFEVPTLEGLVPRMIAGKIDDGMRSGIPEEDWASVITVYGSDADRIVALTGNEQPRNMRVLLLDAEGRVRWFHDRGFSAAKLLELVRTARELSPATGS